MGRLDELNKSGGEFSQMLKEIKMETEAAHNQAAEHTEASEGKHDLLLFFVLNCF